MTLRQAEIQGVPVCARGGAAVENQLKRDYPKLNLVSGEGFTDTYHRLNNGECFTLATRASDWQKFQRNADVNDQCQLHWIGRAETINSGGAAAMIDIGTHCTSLVLHVIDIHIHEMKVDGFIENAWGDYVESISTKRCVSGDASDETGPERNSLNPIDVGGIFLVHGAMCILAILVALMEKRSKKKNNCWNKTIERKQEGEKQKDESSLAFPPERPTRQITETMSESFHTEHVVSGLSGDFAAKNNSPASSPKNSKMAAISEMLEETANGLRQRKDSITRAATTTRTNADSDDPGEQVLQNSIDALIALNHYFRRQKQESSHFGLDESEAGDYRRKKIAGVL